MLIEVSEPVSGKTLHCSGKSNNFGQVNLGLGWVSKVGECDVHLCTFMLLISRVFLFLVLNFISGALAKLFECCSQLQPGVKDECCHMGHMRMRMEVNHHSIIAPAIILLIIIILNGPRNMELRCFHRMITREVIIIHQILLRQNIRLHGGESSEKRPETDV